MRALACALFTLLAVGACSSPAVGPAAPAAGPHHVFVIVMENHSADEAMQGAFTASLAARSGVAADYHAITHPSVPNYLALSSGQTWGVQDDGYHSLPRQDIGDELTGAGIPWRAYMDGMTAAGCIDSPLPYDPGHNPFAYYGGKCPGNVVPLSEQAADLEGKTPLFSWITPDRCHDGHDCSVAESDSWLRQEAGAIMASTAWKTDGVLIITWDEDDDSASNHVLTLVVTPKLKHAVSSRPYDHYSLLATVEDLLGVKRLANAAKASAMTDLTG